MTYSVRTGLAVLLVLVHWRFSSINFF